MTKKKFPGFDQKEKENIFKYENKLYSTYK